MTKKKRKNLEFAVIGHTLMDSRCYLKEFPKVDEMAILLKPIINSCGGSAANFSYNLAKMGLRVRLISAIGKDNTAKFITQSLREHNIKTNHLRKFKGESGKAIVLIDKNGNVKILESVGVADKYFKPKKKDFKGVNHFHMTGTNLKLLLSFSKYAKRNKITISADIGRSKVKLGTKKLKPLLNRIDVLMLNRTELSFLTGEKTNSIEDIKELLKELYGKFGFLIVVKGGPKESIVYDGNYYYVKKPIKVKVVDTIGAGDAFDAGFISVYKKTNDSKTSLEFALKIASLKIQRLGAQALPAKKIIKKLYHQYLKMK